MPKVLTTVVAVLLSLAAILTIVLLQQRYDSSRSSQLLLGEIEQEFSNMQQFPLQTRAGESGSAGGAQSSIATASERITELAGELDDDSPPASLARLPMALEHNVDTLHDVIGAVEMAPASAAAKPSAEPPVAAMAAAERAFQAQEATQDDLTDILARAGQAYDQRAEAARTQATVGSALTILSLLAAFSVFFSRAHRLAAQNRRLLESSQKEALSDALTGLANRRALMYDLNELFEGDETPRESIFAIFDLDGFKFFNDKFGHPAGDALLTRFASRLSLATGNRARAYRLGGDEFCLLGDAFGSSETLELAAAALAESDDGFEVSCSYGAVAIPAEATTPERALSISDQRLYREKSLRRRGGTMPVV